MLPISLLEHFPLPGAPEPIVHVGAWTQGLGTQQAALLLFPSQPVLPETGVLRSLSELQPLPPPHAVTLLPV